MKIGIVTIYNSQNCGSFLQALALLNYSKELGYDSAIVKNKMYYKNKLPYRSLLSTKFFLAGQKEKASKIIKTSIGFRKARKKHYTCIRPIRDNDVCVYGSDTIWNYNDHYFGKEWKHYWGESFKGKKVAYAPSIGPTPIEDVLKEQHLRECVKSFSTLSVRDENTHKVVCSVVGENADITYVVDPTMLMPRSFYEGIASECKEENFILFYYFGIPDKSYMDAIKKYAKENGKKLVCFGDNIKGVDKQLPFNPLDMMAYYSKADMIITNTFHGNVFSVIFNKPFVNIDAGKAKVDDLLRTFDLSERTAYNAEDFERITTESVDFEAVNEKLAEKRKTSGKYLENALKLCEGGLAE